MRASMVYFAGAGTVIAAIVGGVGGGLLIADMISPKSPKQAAELTRLERRMSPEPIQAAAGPSEPVPYLVAPQLSAPNPPAAAAPAPTQAKTQADNSAATPVPPVDTAAGSKAAVSTAQPAAPTTQAAAHEQTAIPQTVNSEEASKSRDADVKRTTERRRVDRRQQWTEKRRYQQRQDQELRAVEDRVREETEPRREFAVEPVRVESPRIRLFGSE
jgi:flagellar biosynthesis GTPase FlhF